MFVYTGTRSKCFTGQLIGHVLKALPIPCPVHRDSTDKPIQFTPLTKKQATHLYHHARRLERQTRKAGKQDGDLGRNGLKVLETLVYDFLRFATGELMPSIASIAQKAGISVSSVRRGLDKLRAAGVLNWMRRKASALIDGCILWFQKSNAYHIRPVEQWLGYKPASEAPAPDPAAWGATPPLPRGLERAIEMARQSAPVRNLFSVLEEDPEEDVETGMASLFRAVGEREKKFGFTGHSD